MSIFDLNYGEGNWLGLPEFGFTENVLGGNRQSLSDATVRSTTGSEPTMSVAPKTQAQQNYNYTQPSVEGASTYNGGSSSAGGSSSGGGGSSSAGGSSSGGGGPDYEAIKEAERKAAEERAKKIRGQISGAYDPIIAELDRQIGLNPGRRAEQESGIAELAGLQTQQAQGLAEQGESKLRTEQQEALRDLTSDIRNQMQAAGRFIGNVGAGASSASQLASEAITRLGQQGRSDIIREVGSKIQDVRNLATQELNKIQQWKASKMADLANSYTSRIDQLNLMKAEAKGNKSRDVADLQFRLEQSFIDRVRELDNMALSYAQTVDLWQQQRQADLEDYATKLSMSAQYGGRAGGGGANYQLKIDGKGNTYLFDPDTGDITATGTVFEPEESIFGSYLAEEANSSGGGLFGR